MRQIAGLLALLPMISCSSSPRPRVAYQTLKARHTLQIRSATFHAGGPIPKANTSYGANITPQLSWSGLPKGTKSEVLIVEDPDAPAGLFTHWLMYDIEPKTTSLPSGLRSNVGTLSQGLQGMNDTGGLGYFGPRPPDAKPHHYHFQIFALDTKLRHRPGYSKGLIYDEMIGHVLASGDLIGVYKKP